MTGISIAALDHATAAGVDFLQRSQRPTGEFETQLGADMALSPNQCVFDSSPFVTTLVLYSLRHVDHGAVSAMISRGLGFLAAEMEPGGLWRYYASHQWKHRRVPPDLDDTACASFLMARHGRPFPDNRWIFLALRDRHGLYPTWVLPSLSNPRLWILRRIGDWKARFGLPAKPTDERENPRFQAETDPVSAKEVDAVVNANVLLYLGEGHETAAAQRFLVDQVRSGDTRETSVYYPDPLALYYMVARACLESAPSLSEIGAFIGEDTAARQQPDGSFGSALSTALALCTLLTFEPGHPALGPGLNHLITTQAANGSWPRYTLYRGPAEFWGSEELTTGLCLEALSRARKAGS